MKGQEITGKQQRYNWIGEQEENLKDKKGKCTSGEGIGEDNEGKVTKKVTVASVEGDGNYKTITAME